MAIERVEDVALSQVPDLDSRVLGSREQVAAIRVEGNLIHVGGMGIVVLDEPLRSNVPDLNLLVLSTRGDASTVRVELN